MKLLSEDISEYVDGVNSVNDLANYPGHKFLYTRTGRGINLNDRKAVDNFLTNLRKFGFSREYLDLQSYGLGLYTSLNLRDCINNSDGYGKIIIKVWVSGFNRCLIDRGCHVYGHDLAELVYGRDCSINSQIKRLFKPEYQAKYAHVNNIEAFQNQECETVLQENNIDGIIYNWGYGHWVCVWKDFDKCFPFEVSFNLGKTFHKFGDEETLNATLMSWEPTRVLGKEMKNYKAAENYRDINGYIRVETSKGFNFINPKAGRQVLSSTWFNLASHADENEVATVKYNGKTFWYYLPDDEIYEIDGDDPEDALMLSDPLGTSADLPMITAKTAMEENKPVFGNLLTEVINEYIPGANRDTIHDKDSNGLVCFYRLSKPNQLESIAFNGFTKEFRGTGDDNSDALGSGTYGTVNAHWNVIPKYGNILWRYGTPASLVANTYISPDPHLAKRFGIKGSFAEQLERFFPDLVPLWKKEGVWDYIITPKYNPGASKPSGSLTIRALNNKVFDGIGGKSDHFYHSHGINGIIYHGDYDGDAVVTFDDSTIIPIAWRDNSKRGSEWHKVEITDNLWDRTFNGYDPLPFLKGTYRDYEDDPNVISQNYRVQNGFMLVRNKKTKKYNYVKAPEGGRNFASSIWFDLASPVDESGMSTIKYNGKTFWYYLPDDEIYEIDGDDPEDALMLSDPLGTSADLPMITAKTAME